MVVIKRGGTAYGISSRPVSILAHILAAAAVALMLVWILHCRGGVSFKSHHIDQELNAHALFMVTGLVICGGEAILAYKTLLPGTRKVKKLLHMLLHLVALGLGGLGLFAIFKFHKDLGLKDMHSLHSWLGIGTLCLYALQWLLGFTYFLFPGSTMTMRADYAPWHIFFGVVIFLMAVCTAETGLSKMDSPGAKLGREAFLANFTGVAILLFGVAVVFGVILP